MSDVPQVNPVTTLREAAEQLGVTQNDIAKWLNLGEEYFNPLLPDGSYDLNVIVRARDAYKPKVNYYSKPSAHYKYKQKLKAEKESDPLSEIDPADPLLTNPSADLQFTGQEDFDELKLLRLRLDCVKTHTQNQILTSKYTPVDKVLTQIRTVIYALKEKFLRLPSEMAYEVSGVTPADAEERLHAAIVKILDELTNEDYPSLEQRLQTFDSPEMLVEGDFGKKTTKRAPRAQASQQPQKPSSAS